MGFFIGLAPTNQRMKGLFDDHDNNRILPKKNFRAKTAGDQGNLGNGFFVSGNKLVICGHIKWAFGNKMAEKRKPLLPSSAEKLYKVSSYYRDWPKKNLFSDFFLLNLTLKTARTWVGNCRIAEAERVAPSSSLALIAWIAQIMHFAQYSAMKKRIEDEIYSNAKKKISKCLSASRKGNRIPLSLGKEKGDLSKLVLAILLYYRLAGQ